MGGAALKHRPPPVGAIGQIPDPVSAENPSLKAGSLLDSGGAFSDVSVARFRGGFRRKRGPLPGGAVGQISDPVFAGGAGFRAGVKRAAGPDFGPLQPG